MPSGLTHSADPVHGDPFVPGDAGKRELAELLPVAPVDKGAGALLG